MARKIRIKVVIPVDVLGDVGPQITRDAGGRIILYRFDYLSLRADYVCTWVGETAELATHTPSYTSIVS